MKRQAPDNCPNKKINREKKFPEKKIIKRQGTDNCPREKNCTRKKFLRKAPDNCQE